MDFKKERGYYLLLLAKGPFIITLLVILYPICLDLAKFHREDDGLVKFLGVFMSPATLVFTVSTFTSLAIIFMVPVVGAISDINNNRQKIITAMSIIFLTVTSLSFLILRENLWYLAALIQFITVFTIELYNVVLYAFLPYIGKNEKDLSRLSSFGTMSENASMVIFILLLPFLLKTGKSHNLIMQGDFDYYKSYESWGVNKGGEFYPCQKNFQNAQDEYCFISSNAGKHGLHELTISVPGGEMVKLGQSSEFTTPASGHYSFTAIIASRKNDVTSTQLSVSQLDAAGNVLKVDDSQKIQLTEKKSLIRLMFDRLEKTEKIQFNLSFEGNKAAVVHIDKIETVMPVEIRQIFAIFSAGIFFAFCSLLAIQMIKGQDIQIEEESSTTDNRGGFRETLNTIRDCFGQKDTFLFLLVNMFWYGGYVIWSMLQIVYLEDKYNMGSFKLAILFIVLCCSTILGALIHFYLESKINHMKLAYVFFGIWVFIPFFIFVKPSNIPRALQLLCVVFVGICLGVVMPLKMMIYAIFVPKSQAGKYMALFFFTSKLMDLMANIFILVLLRMCSKTTVIALSSAFFGIAYVLLLSMGSPNRLRKHSEIVLQREIQFNV